MIFNWLSFLVLGFGSIVVLAHWVCLCYAQNGVRPATVNVGALVAYDTTIGRVAKKAIELALEDVNEDKTLLNGTQIVLTTMDTNCSAFIGTAAGEQILSGLGRIVLIIWLFVVLIINSSYTASLTSILTVRQLSTTIKGIDDLIASNLPIGCLTGSFVRNYLSGELNIAQSRLISLDSPESYAKALSDGPSRGGVGAIVDEIPSVQLFLSTHCGFSIVGQPFTKGGWGFAFQKGFPLQLDISTAILNLSETDELKRIHDKWLSANRCISHANQDGPKKLGLESFWGLFLISGVAAFAALLGFVCHLALQFRHHTGTSDDSLRSGSVLRDFASFVDQKEIDQRNERSKRRRTEEQGEINRITSECTSSHHTI